MSPRRSQIVKRRAGHLFKIARPYNPISCKLMLATKITKTQTISIELNWPYLPSELPDTESSVSAGFHSIGTVDFPLSTSQSVGNFREQIERISATEAMKYRPWIEVVDEEIEVLAKKLSKIDKRLQKKNELIKKLKDECAGYQVDVRRCEKELKSSRAKIECWETCREDFTVQFVLGRVKHSWCCGDTPGCY